MFHMGRGGCGPRFGAGPRGGSRRWGPFEVRWEVSDEGRGAGGGRRGRMFDGGELRLVLLKLIADQPRHGYDLIREIEELTGGAYAPSPGTVYPTLTLLGDMGLIEESASEGAKKLYAATEAGRAHLAENAEQVAALMARLAEIGSHRARHDRGPVRRAMGNLRMVLGERLSGEMDADLSHEIAGVLDEAAQRIERLKR